MTIDEAIAILEALYRGGISPRHDNPKEAFKLGIEALKAVKNARANSYWTPIPQLPGETEE